MNKLKSQVRLFQELFQKEKTVNCELTRKLQPQAAAAAETYVASARAFDSSSMLVTDSIGMSAAGASSSLNNDQ